MSLNPCQVLNLARFISVTKTRPLTWRLDHPYLIADRYDMLQHAIVCCIVTSVYGQLHLTWSVGVLLLLQHVWLCSLYCMPSSVRYIVPKPSANPVCVSFALNPVL
jgi:hypothetical protein